MGGLGRSRGRKAPFDARKVRGMYDDIYDDKEGQEGDPSEEESNRLTLHGSVRREGVVHLLPRAAASPGESGWLCFVQDRDDGTLRACALRTLVDLQGALAGLGIDAAAKPPSDGDAIRHPCTYVAGSRRQKWALLGGEVPGLSGETAIAVRLALSKPSLIEVDSTRKHSCGVVSHR